MTTACFPATRKVGGSARGAERFKGAKRNDPSRSTFPRVAALLKKIQAHRGRLIFALDATASREADLGYGRAAAGRRCSRRRRGSAASMCSLLYYRGNDEVRRSSWFSDAHELVRRMNMIRCMAGTTKIARVLRHIRAENEREKVSAAIFVGDAVEEPPRELYRAAAGSGRAGVSGSRRATAWSCCSAITRLISVMMRRRQSNRVFRELARLTGGAYGKFDAGAAKQLAELLRAVAAFAVGGITALANQHTDSARLLLGQMK